MNTKPPKIVKSKAPRSEDGGNIFAPLYSVCADFEDGSGRELKVSKIIFLSSLKMGFSLLSNP